MLKSLDLEYHNLHPGEDFAMGLKKRGRGPRLTTDKVVQLAQDHPPRNTGRSVGELVRHLLAGGGPGRRWRLRLSTTTMHRTTTSSTGRNFKLRGLHRSSWPIHFKTYVQDVRGHLAGRSAFPNPRILGEGRGIAADECLQYPQ